MVRTAYFGLGCLMLAPGFIGGFVQFSIGAHPGPWLALAAAATLLSSGFCVVLRPAPKSVTGGTGEKYSCG
jgi:hypothetical protein